MKALKCEMCSCDISIFSGLTLKKLYELAFDQAFAAFL